MSGNNASLKSVASVVSAEFRQIFPFPFFNHMQSIVAREAFGCDENLVISAPTGSGKTVIHELAICRVLQQRGSRSVRSVYIAPNKYLCQQKAKEWTAKFSKVHQKVIELTGDSDPKESLLNVAKASIIVTTPEKWDSMTRSWRDHIYLMSNIDLLLVDEIHHLGEDRGATLEAVVVRMKYLASLNRDGDENSSPQRGRSRMRIVGLSATLPNIAEVGEWLGCSPHHIHYFDNTFRPVPLEVHTLNYGPAPNPFLFERSLDSKVVDVIRRFSDGRQVLVFCSSKKNTETVAEKLHQANLAGTRGAHSASNIPHIEDRVLLALIQHGIAYHHAGLLPSDRSAVEALFELGHIRLLCSTSTLAHGINLPAYLVVIKGTFSWRGSVNGYEKLGRSEVVQMVGRAGRPGFDTNGVAVVMTNQEDLHLYSNVTSGIEQISSQLEKSLNEVINAEISQGVITCLDDCMAWICSTFFFTCLKKTKTKSTEPNTEIHSLALDSLIENVCKSTIINLNKAGIVQYSDGGSLFPNNECHIMARTMTKLKSMITCMNIPRTAGLNEVLRNISDCEEIHRPVRRDEKKNLNDLKSLIRFPLKDKVQLPQQKSNILLQLAINRTVLKDFSLKVEQAEIVEKSIRLLKCIVELAINRCFGKLLESALLLDRALKVRLWETSNQNIFAQCKNLSIETLERLKELGKTNIHHIFGASPQMLQSEVGCSHDEIRALLCFSNEMMANKLMLDLSESNESEIIIRIRPAEAMDNRRKSAVIHYQLVCYERESGDLICWRSLPVGALEQEYRLRNTKAISIDRFRCALLANVVGIDYYIGMSPLQRDNHVEEVNTRKTSAVGEKSKTAKAVKSRVTPNSHPPVSRTSKEPGMNAIDLDRFRYRQEPQSTMRTVSEFVDANQVTEPHLKDNTEQEVLQKRHLPSEIRSTGSIKRFRSSMDSSRLLQTLQNPQTVEKPASIIPDRSALTLKPGETPARDVPAKAHSGETDMSFFDEAFL